MSYLIHNMYIYYGQSMSLEEQATTPNCNLSETVHHSWHAASGKKGVDLFEVTVDDLA